MTGSAMWQSRLHASCPGAKSRFRRVISSAVERFVHIEDVGSSNLSSPTNFPEAGCILTLRPFPVAIAGQKASFAAPQASACAPRYGASPLSADWPFVRDWLPHFLELAKGGAGGRLAQLVERFVYTEDVGSSSLSSPTMPPPPADKIQTQLAGSPVARTCLQGHMRHQGRLRGACWARKRATTHCTSSRKKFDMSLRRMFGTELRTCDRGIGHGL